MVFRLVVKLHTRVLDFYNICVIFSELQKDFYQLWKFSPQDALQIKIPFELKRIFGNERDDLQTKVKVFKHLAASLNSPWEKAWTSNQGLIEYNKLNTEKGAARWFVAIVTCARKEVNYLLGIRPVQNFYFLEDARFNIRN